MTSYYIFSLILSCAGLQGHEDLQLKSKNFDNESCSEGKISSIIHRNLKCHKIYFEGKKASPLRIDRAV